MVACYNKGMKREARIYEEAGAHYSHGSEADSTPVKITFSPDFQPFTMNWESPNGTKGQTVIYTTSEEALRKLMRRWNRDGWRYEAA